MVRKLPPRSLCAAGRILRDAMIENLFSLKGRIALVTGGSRGIGKMIAQGFVESGAKVYISSRKADACDATAAELSKLGHVHLPAAGHLDRRRLQGAGGADLQAGRQARHPGQQCRRSLGRGLRRVPGAWLGQGDEPQRQVALLPDAGAARRADEGGVERGAPRQGDQHLLDRRHHAQPAGDLFLSRIEIVAASI